MIPILRVSIDTAMAMLTLLVLEMILFINIIMLVAAGFLGGNRVLKG